MIFPECIYLLPYLISLGSSKENDECNINALSKSRGGLARQEAVDGKGPLLRVRYIIELIYIYIYIYIKNQVEMEVNM